MLYATVRNRKISVKKPTTIPQGSQNVDELKIDFDEEWNGLAKVCIFTNHYVTEKKQQKTVTETVTTTVVTENGEGGKELSKDETTDITTEYIDVTDDTVQDKDTTTTTVETTEGKDTTTTVTTVTTVTVDKPIIKAEEAEVSYEQLVEGSTVNVPWECLENVGQLSISVRGYNSDNSQIMTTMEADSFWEVVESGKAEGEEAKEAAATLYEQAVTAIGNAEAASAEATRISADVANKAASGKFNGKDGRNGTDGVTPVVSVGIVETTEAGSQAEVTATGTATNVKLNFKLPRGPAGKDGKDGTNGSNGKDGKNGVDGKDGRTPERGVDYWTDEDKAEFKSYIDSEIGGIEASLDSIITIQESYIARSPVPANEEESE